MKYIISLTILLSIIALPAHSELTPTDLDKIREIVKETVSESEKRTKEYVDIKFDSLEKNVNERFNSVDKRMTHQANITYGLMVLVAVAIGFPAWRSQKDRSLEKQMEALTQEIEILKKQRIQSP
jgi:hypothetical protein